MSYFPDPCLEGPKLKGKEDEFNERSLLRRVLNIFMKKNGVLLMYLVVAGQDHKICLCPFVTGIPEACVLDLQKIFLRPEKALDVNFWNAFVIWSRSDFSKHFNISSLFRDKLTTCLKRYLLFTTLLTEHNLHFITGNWRQLEQNDKSKHSWHETWSTFVVETIYFYRLNIVEWLKIYSCRS